MKITSLNIDDIIREEKRIHRAKGLDNYAFYWGKDGYEILKRFFSACLPCRHGWFCLCDDGVDDRVRSVFKQGMSFMGVRHFWDKRKNGYKFLYRPNK